MKRSSKRRVFFLSLTLGRLISRRPNCDQQETAAELVTLLLRMDNYTGFSCTHWVEGGDDRLQGRTLELQSALKA